MTLYFRVDGTPISKARARVLRSGRSYTPARTKAAEDKIAIFAKQAMMGKWVTTDKPVNLILTFVMPRPKNHYRSNGKVKPQFAGLTHIIRPDLDNMVKLVKDALNGIAWKDDSQIVSLNAVKIYEHNQGEAHTEINIGV